MKETIIKALKEVGLEIAVLAGKKVVEIATEIQRLEQNKKAIETKE